eukprot:CAMPEP_0196161758 /NCGR_PEP_ID=MMETSP0910-20130528/47493_1 /TAXON_ID=49265 /ORGANISM="Thalassiosira rotula, Strain GSO102" /LENGTH=1123 /DNA_ID=CAMNT_0041426703 /DNA_START=163 /DNA_END=3534 /DNA_ORIENTATION=-
MKQQQPQIHHVDGPMLPHLNHFPPQTTDNKTNSNNNGLPRGSTSLVPILTPPHNSDNGYDNDGDYDGDDNAHTQQYLLVPNPQRIVVRSARHGHRVCDLLPRVVDDDSAAATTAATTAATNAASKVDGVTIRAVALAWLPNKEHNGDEEDQDEDDDDDDDDADDDESSAASTNGEWIILAACSNGMLYEWNVADLSSSSSPSKNNPNESIIGPRRSFRLASCASMKNAELMHLASVQDASPSNVSSAGGAVLYGLAMDIPMEETKENNGRENTALVRCVIPPFAPEDERHGPTSEPAPITAKQLATVKRTSYQSHEEESSKSEHVCLKMKDAIFGLMAAYRPSSKSGGGYDDDDRMDYEVNNDGGDGDDVGGHVFLVLVASHGLIVCRDDTPQHQNDDSNSGGVVDPSPSLVHFAMKSSSQSHGHDGSLSSVAVSPNARDLAVGRANGRIEVLDNVFENAANYFDDASPKEGKEHPEETTVRKTVHWHAHPVRALSFVASSSGGNGNGNGGFANPSGLLSGGEESVLVTWQLDRNFHRPSNFVARVSHGAIVHVANCPHSNRVYVFCSDDTVQCIDGTNYACVWKERGLAGMALSHDEEEYDREEKEDGSGRGAVIVVKDPITELPMLTNLPGAPGMVHWYDPRSASVVGTLEVAPYNRVSRRDPTDPHVPAPTVTHMAIGENGKDLVTVDTVWTENTSVGRTHDPSGPRGPAMNAYTSIKFWSHVDGSSIKRNKSDQHKRRNGDVPMGYELVSSMAAPHGRNGAVCALAVSPDGSAACTLSREEDTFRMWVKSANVGGGASTSAGSTLWKCLYKVKTPSGYANLLSRSGASSSVSGGRPVAFSSDGTVLSVSYGPYVTLWDYSNATLLTSVTLDGDNGNEHESGIRSVDFLTKSDDAMLLTTAGRVGVKSPFGGVRSRYLGDDEWSFDVRAFGEGAVVSAVVPLYDFEGASGGGGYFAVSITCASRSVVSIIGREEGGVVCVKDADGCSFRWPIDGEVQSLCVDECSGSSVRLLAITRDWRMLSLSIGSKNGPAARKRIQAVSERENVLAQPRAPVLKSGAATTTDGEVVALQSSMKRRKVSIGNPGKLTGEDVISGFEFPNALSGKFTSAFIAKSLGIKNR